MNSGECSNGSAPAAVLPHGGDIRAQLARIVASEVFRGALRLTRFLQFVVETTLAGKAGTIKAYTVAVEALGRGDDFDPQADPIVRVGAVRLRAALARYYRGPGRNDPIIIAMGCGSYVPSFHQRGAALDLLAADRFARGSRRSDSVVDMAGWARQFERRRAELKELEQNRAALAEEVERTLARSRRLREEMAGGGERWPRKSDARSLIHTDYFETVETTAIDARGEFLPDWDNGGAT